jgi:hypothetical protein
VVSARFAFFVIDAVPSRPQAFEHPPDRATAPAAAHKFGATGTPRPFPPNSPGPGTFFDKLSLDCREADTFCCSPKGQEHIQYRKYSR